MSNDTPARLGAQPSTPRSLLARLFLPLVLVAGLAPASIGLGAATTVAPAVTRAPAPLVGHAGAFVAGRPDMWCGALPLPC